MNKQLIISIRSVAAIFWLGFFMAISFMEAPLKFTAPGISLAQGLQIGKIIFGALNICEWVFLAIILVTCLFKSTSKRTAILIVLIAIILLTETAWLLPYLDARANKIISGQQVASSSLHWLYVLLELIKVPVLLLIGWEGIRNSVSRVAATSN